MSDLAYFDQSSYFDLNAIENPQIQEYTIDKDGVRTWFADNPSETHIPRATLEDYIIDQAEPDGYTPAHNWVITAYIGDDPVYTCTIHGEQTYTPY